MQAAVRSLVELGLTPLEAAVYSHLAGGRLDTGYGIAKALGKPRANVYQAVRTLQLKGAVIADDGETQRLRAVPPDELLDRLERRFKESRQRAERELARQPDAVGDARVYRLDSAEQVLERCRRMIAGATEMVVVDAFPAPLTAVAAELEAAVRRGAMVAVKAYAPFELAGAQVSLEPNADSVRRRWPADWINLVADGEELVLALLETGRGGAPGGRAVQAVWSASPYLSWIVYGYLIHELMITAVDDALAADSTAEEIVETYGRVRHAMPIEGPGYHRLLRRLGSGRHDAKDA